MLRVSALNAGYGSLQVLWDVHLEVGCGELVALVGPNGAGKTTLLRVVMGLLPAWSGRVEFQGTLLSAMSTPAIVERGVTCVPEGRRLFAGLTVEENLRLGAFAPAARRLVEQSLQEVYHLFPVLARRRRQLAGTLSGGEQQMLAIGRALMSRPRLLLLDEPSLGLAPHVVRHMFAIIESLRQGGRSLLLVEQNVRRALEIADRAYVLESGRVVLAGPAAAIRDHPHVVQTYIGRQG
ncbi:MAG TPA: ABC transporter ATP-binding protein [Limnochordales bacterium]